MLRQVSEKVEIPGEPGEWMRFQSLTYGQREAAREVAKTKALDEMARQLKALEMLSGDGYQKALSDAAGRRSETPAKPDLLVQFDAATVVDGGIAEWSYDAKPSKPSEQLDADGVEWAARQILERSQRPPANAPDSTTS